MNRPKCDKAYGDLAAMLARWRVRADSWKESARRWKRDGDADAADLAREAAEEIEQCIKDIEARTMSAHERDRNNL